MVDRNFSVIPNPGLLDQWFGTPVYAAPEGSAVGGLPSGAAAAPLPGLLDDRGSWQGAAPDTRSGGFAAAPAPADDPTDSSLIGQLSRAGYGWDLHGTMLDAYGRRVLIRNPILEIQWQPGVSAWSGAGRFEQPLLDRLRAGNNHVNPVINDIAPGSIQKTPGQNATIEINKWNGDLAADEIARRWRELGYDVQREVPRAGQPRRVDVVVHQPAADPRYSKQLEIESKIGVARLKGLTARHVERDIAALQNNKSVRQDGEFSQVTGKTFRNVGRVVRPLCVTMDALGPRFGLPVPRAIWSARTQGGRRLGRSTAGPPPMNSPLHSTCPWHEDDGDRFSAGLWAPLFERSLGNLQPRPSGTVLRKAPAPEPDLHCRRCKADQGFVIGKLLIVASLSVTWPSVGGGGSYGSPVPVLSRSASRGVLHIAFITHIPSFRNASIGRDAGFSEKQAQLSVGQEGHASSRRPR